VNHLKKITKLLTLLSLSMMFFPPVHPAQAQGDDSLNLRQQLMMANALKLFTALTLETST
jgi:hypothetical protein